MRQSFRSALTDGKRLKFSRPPGYPMTRGWCGFIFVVLVIVGFPSIGTAQEITPFRIYGIRGYAALRYLFEEDSSRRGSEVGESYQRRPVFEEEIYILTHSYIYHPNFLKLDLGGGPLFAQETFESDGQQISSSDIFYNATVHLTFLEKKPYPLILYYDRSYPRIPLGMAERFFLTDTKYGFKSRIPLGPVPLRLEGYRQTQKGESFTQLTDEAIDHLRLLADDFPLWQGDGSMLYQFDRRDSASGNPQFPIQETRTTTHSMDINTRQLFGSRDQGYLQNFFFFFKQLEYPERQDIRLIPDLRWELTDSLTWRSRCHLATSRVEGVNTTHQAARTGLQHWLYQSLFSKLGVYGDKTRTKGLSNQGYGGAGSVLYQKKVPVGSFSLQFGALYDINDRRSTASEVQVFGESHVLIGLFPSELRYDNVIASSVEVFNETRSRIFIEGLDYRLTVVGVKTRIERLPTGDIQDGETVLVDYSFATTGTFKFSIFDRSYEANINLFSYLFLRARFRNAPQRLLAGISTQPLNSVRSQLYRARVRVPIGGFVIEGDSEYENHQEEISPFQRASYSLSFQIPLPFSTTLTPGGHRVLVDYLESIEDVDLTGGRVRLESHPPWTRARLSAEAIYDEDIGGTRKRRDWSGTLRAEWWIRQIVLRAEGVFRREQQWPPEFERERIRVKLEIRREF